MRQKMADFLNALLGLRKFIAFLLVFGIAIGFRCIGFVNGSEFVDLLKNVTLGFFASNGLEHFTTMAKDFIASKADQGKIPNVIKDVVEKLP